LKDTVQGAQQEQKAGAAQAEERDKRLHDLQNTLGVERKRTAKSDSENAKLQKQLRELEIANAELQLQYQQSQESNGSLVSQAVELKHDLKQAQGERDTMRDAQSKVSTTAPAMNTNGQVSELQGKLKTLEEKHKVKEGNVKSLGDDLRKAKEEKTAAESTFEFEKAQTAEQVSLNMKEPMANIRCKLWRCPRRRPRTS
jgi:chromosome segregation ATPase